MMTVMIPTKNRPDKLAVCLRSIPDWVAVSIVATKSDDLPIEAKNKKRVHTSVLIAPDMTVPKAFNHMASTSMGDVIMSSDDVEYEEDAFDIVQASFCTYGHDIVFGMHVINMECNEDAFQCVGVTFKFEHAPLYCEEYHHFYIDTEVGDKAKALGKFIYLKQARLKNFHPSSGYPADETHTHLRLEKLSHDTRVYEERKLHMANGRILH